MRKYMECVWSTIKLSWAKLFGPGKYVSYSQVIKDSLESGDYDVVEGVFHKK